MQQEPKPAPPQAGSPEQLAQGGSDQVRPRLRELELDPPPFEEPAPKSSWSRWLWGALWLALGLSALGATALVLAFVHFSAGLPDVERLESGYQPPQVTRILARDGTLLANLFTERRTVVPFESIPAHAKLAFLAAEDASFYEHEGLNYLGMLRALWSNLRAGRTRQGGSTITQQVVKNVLLDPERSYERKIRETILARRVEEQLSKDRIFGLYLNHIYLGHGRYGIEEASRYYFGVGARDLTLDQAALLAGIVASPERFSPRNSEEKALGRRRYVLAQMLAKGFVTQELMAQALATRLRLAPPVEAESELAPEIVPVVEKLLSTLAPEQARMGGFTVHTTIDPTLQSEARQSVRQNLQAYARRHKLAPPFTLKQRRLWGKPFEGKPRAHKTYVGAVVAVDDAQQWIEVKVGDVLGRVLLKHEGRYNPERLAPSAFTEVGAGLRVSLLAEPGDESHPVPLRLELGPQAALVAIDPRSRHVLALVGNQEALMGGLDRATHARRQPGSAFKPLLFSYALHSRRYTPASQFLLPPAKPGEEPRQMLLRTGVARSDNAVAEKVLEVCGASNVVDWSRSVGIESALGATPSLALGAYEVTPLELTNAYATFASGGEWRAPIFVTKVLSPDGGELMLPDPPAPRSVMSPEEAYLTTSVLTSVIEEGTGRAARSLARPLAGKTGTTNKAKDAWFVGYSTDLVAGVWVGYDDALPLGASESGAITALPAWVSFMKAGLARRPKTAFARPPGVTVVFIDPVTGLLARPEQTDAREEEFLDGTEPQEQAPLPEGADGAAGLLAPAATPELIDEEVPELPVDGSRAPEGQAPQVEDSREPDAAE